MKKILFVLLIILLSSQAFAMHTAVFGGVRNGAAIGIIWEPPLFNEIHYRLGVEGTTGPQPFIMFLGLRDYLLTAGSVPISLRLSLLGYLGNTSYLGPSFSFIFDNLAGNNQLFFETGADFAGSPQIMAQIGYKLGKSWAEEKK